MDNLSESNVELHIFTNSAYTSPRTDLILKTFNSFLSGFNVSQIKVTVWLDSKPKVRLAKTYYKNLKKKFLNVKESKSLSDGYLNAIKISNSRYLFMLEHDWVFSNSIAHSLKDIIDNFPIQICHMRFNAGYNVSNQYESLKLSKSKKIPHLLTNLASNNPHIINRELFLKTAVNLIQRQDGSKGIEELLSNQNLPLAVYGILNQKPLIFHTNGRFPRWKGEIWKLKELMKKKIFNL